MNTANVLQLGKSTVPAKQDRRTAESDGDTHSAPRERDVRAEVRGLLANGMTQARVARECGSSAARLGQWLAGTYSGDNSAMSAQVASWIDARNERAAAVVDVPDVPTYIETPTAQRILSAVQFAHSCKDLCLIAGAAGVGKTVAVSRYVATRPNAWIVTMTPATSGLVPVLEEIAAALGLEVQGGAATIYRAIVPRLKGSDGLLVIDEAQHLTTTALDQVRAISDTAGVGVVFVGNDASLGRMANSDQTYAQIASRLRRRVHLKQTRAGDVAALLKAWRITGADQARAARAVVTGTGGGSLRDLVKTLRLAFSMGGEKTTGAMITQARESLIRAM